MLKLQDHIQHLEKQIQDFRNEVSLLEHRIGDASFLLMGWDGCYDPHTGRGSVKGLASLVEDAYGLLQGRSWRDPSPPSEKRRGDIEGQLLLWEDED